MNCHSTKTGDDMAEHKTKPMVSTQILVICIAVMAIAITAVTVFKVSVGSLFFVVALLACPLMHILMMKNMNHKDEQH